MYQVGSFPNWDIWAEWNGKFRDDVRRFIRCVGGGKKRGSRILGFAAVWEAKCIFGGPVCGGSSM